MVSSGVWQLMRPRIIPTLTVSSEGLYRTRAFRKPLYVGDPLNALRIFNEKEVDELCVMDIGPRKHDFSERLSFYEELAQEAFMPLSFGGHLDSLAQMRQIFRAGYEKVIVNTAAVATPSLVKEAAALFGSQSVVVSIDVGRSMFKGERVVVDRGRRPTRLEPVEWASECERLGAGELILRSIRCDGEMQGLDLDLIKRVSSVVDIPVVGVGGAGSLEDLRAALQAGAHAVAAGSLFVYQGPRRAVLINYPAPHSIESLSA